MGPIWWYGGTLLVVQWVPMGVRWYVLVRCVQQVTRNAIFGAHCAVAGAFPGRRSNAHLGPAHPHQNHHHHHHHQHHQDPPNADAVCEMKEVEVGAEPALRGEGRRLEGWRAQHWRRLTFQATALTPALPSAHPPPPPPPQPSSASASTVACVRIPLFLHDVGSLSLQHQGHHFNDSIIVSIVIIRHSSPR